MTNSSPSKAKYIEIKKIISFVSTPKIAFRCAVSFLLFWFALGLSDQFLFGTKEQGKFFLYINSASQFTNQDFTTSTKIRWINDYLGHWASVFAVICAVLTRFWNVFLSAETSDFIKQQYKKAFEKNTIFWAPCLLTACIILAIANGHLTSTNTKELYWQAEIFDPVLPYLIGLLFYIMVLFPVLMCFVKVLTKLQIICLHCKHTKSFNIKDPKGMYGLENLGGLINAFLSITLLSSFPMLMIQLSFKTGLSLGNLVGFLVLAIILYHTVLSPLLILNKNLQSVRQDFLAQTRQEWERLNQRISAIPHNTVNEAQVNLIEVERKVVVQKLELCKKMKLTPLSIKSKILAVLSAIPSATTIILKLFGIGSLLPGPAALAETTVAISKFKEDKLTGWSEQSFKGNTIYSLENIDFKHAIKAESNNSASALFKEKDINLKKYPYLNWCWRSVKRMDEFDEKTKAGDDYTHRVYVISNNGVFNLQAKWINYVWSANNQKHTSWANAFLPRAKMYVIRDKSDSLNEWLCEKRNVRDDFKELHGKDIKQVNITAIMTDSDNTHSTNIGYYSNIYFSKK